MSPIARPNQNSCGEDLALARYYSSKQFALRMGIFRASRYYFCKYFGIPPYDVCQSFREGNQIYGQYLCAPGDVEEYGYRPYTGYKMTTEGLYGELFESAERFFPEDWERVRASVGRNLHELPEGTPADWNVLEPSGVYLMSLALDEKVPSAFFEKELARIRSRGMVILQVDEEIKAIGIALRDASGEYLLSLATAFPVFSCRMSDAQNEGQLRFAAAELEKEIRIRNIRIADLDTMEQNRF